MICEHKITAKKNGDFLLEGEGVEKVIQSGDMLTVKFRTDTIKLTLITEETDEPRSGINERIDWIGRMEEADKRIKSARAFLVKKEKSADDNSEDTQQLAIASWIIANDGYNRDEGAWVSCDGEGGDFPGTPCPLEVIEKYHQQKAEAAKKQEQETKQEPARICGNCKHIHITLSSQRI